MVFPFNLVFIGRSKLHHGTLMLIYGFTATTGRGSPFHSLVPQCVHRVRTILAVAKRPAPIQGWLVLQAIRFAALRGRRHDIPFNLGGFWPSQR
jgi:hypothetical protein